MDQTALERIEIFTHEGKTILYFDLSDITTNAQLDAVVRQAMAAMQGRAEQSVYTITNITRIAFDTKTKELAAEWMAFNRPFVIAAAFLGASGARKLMMHAVFTLSGRANTRLFHDKEQALAWIAAL